MCSTYPLHSVSARALPSWLPPSLSLYIYLFTIFQGKVPVHRKVNSGHGSWQRSLLFNRNQQLKSGLPNIWLADVPVLHSDRDPARGGREPTGFVSSLPKPDVILLDNSLQMTCSPLTFWALQGSSQSPCTAMCPADFPISIPQTWHWPCLPGPGWLPEDPESSLESDRTRFPWQRLHFQAGSGSPGGSFNLSSSFKPLVPGSKEKKKKASHNIYPPRTVIKIWWRLCIWSTCQMLYKC